MAPIERALLPTEHNSRQKILVLRGLGGIGKIQLAFEFARRHHRKFSSVFWVDGRNEYSVKRSIARHAASITAGQIPEISRSCLSGGSVDIDTVVKDVMGWLRQPDNSSWLLIFDNVDLDYSLCPADPGAYDVRRFLSGANHGSILITTRLARLEQLGEAYKLRKVDRAQAQAILDSWYKIERDIAETGELLDRLDGLPLAIAQAGAYLQESGIDVRTYLQFYDKEWRDLFEAQDEDEPPLKDYEDRSIWTTWSISYTAIQKKNKTAANLLLLWSYLDNKDLRHEWIGDAANQKFKFVQAMTLLQNYSLVESGFGKGSYSTHPVVHRWAYYYRARTFQFELSQLVLLSVGWALPPKLVCDHSAIERRLLPYAQACTRWIVPEQMSCSGSLENSNTDSTRPKQEVAMLQAIHYLGILYAGQDNMAEAETLYVQALQGKEKVLGLKHTSTLWTVNSLGILYQHHGKLADAEMMYMRALEGKEEALGLKHTSKLNTVNNLGNLYERQGKLADAEVMYTRALEGKEEALGLKHTSTLDTVNDLGILYKSQGKLADAEVMYARALQGYEEALRERVSSHIPALNTMYNLGSLLEETRREGAAKAMYTKALSGLASV
ncbi:MAG: hypothetical protein M1822_008785 [Bathelium mastoideum]|nr:MAG: hypothetical protein M1822_008785 [Bathelium mastoideum]